ncbi:MAG: hypothetical protein COV30_02500 [Candidatus Yanofskybacteria bacterium CG10_big_fil_rev_8_21_14_0_10_37_15]|uniref:Uncharacterized protein n=1 Tax=Candidatus Yanofskybacteria bacterium CG10_big_fil_rev_8_21_14_0_10_37_15 TaxID=1975097 RepID=A0A2H0R587_9BACT|nr:MAG: hypothetical protein COV30_02500 [Candidatus Yanofskybacteria bacterium CG10_big_fil_rev_8_21_14_0_10_37_15]
MNWRVLVAAALVLGILLVGLATNSTLSTSSTTTFATDLYVGQKYEVNLIEKCSLPSGESAFDINFGGRDRSLRNQLIPEFDGRGRQIFREAGGKYVSVRGSISGRKPEIMIGTISEADPSLEGFSYGNYSWKGLEVVYYDDQKNKIPTKISGPCGPAR